MHFARDEVGSNGRARQTDVALRDRRDRLRRRRDRIVADVSQSADQDRGRFRAGRSSRRDGASDRTTPDVDPRARRRHRQSAGSRRHHRGARGRGDGQVIYGAPVETPVVERSIEDNSGGELNDADAMSDVLIDSIAGAMAEYIAPRDDAIAALRVRLDKLAALRKKVVEGAFDEVRRDIDRLAAHVNQLDGRIDMLLRMTGSTAATKHVEDTSREVIHWRTVREARR